MPCQINTTPQRIIISKGWEQVKLTKPEALQVATDILQTATAEGWIDKEAFDRMTEIFNM